MEGRDQCNPLHSEVWDSQVVGWKCTRVLVRMFYRLLRDSELVLVYANHIQALQFLIDGTCRPASGATPPGLLTVVFRSSSQSLASRASTVFSVPFVHLMANECPRPSTFDRRLPFQPSALPSPAPQALPSHFHTFYFSPATSASRLAIHALGCNFASCLFPLRSIRRRMVNGSLRSP